jgi:hypothetical protein
MNGNAACLHTLACYTPRVGDWFHKPAGICPNPMTGETKPTLERNARVTMMSHGHVVVLIDGLESTMRRGHFIAVAVKTLVNGATLARGSE